MFSRKKIYFSGQGSLVNARGLVAAPFVAVSDRARSAKSMQISRAGRQHSLALFPQVSGMASLAFHPFSLDES
jgi:hypothetical protein